MTLPVYYYVLGTPLGVLGLFRWSCWLVRRIPAVMYKPIVNNYRTTMSIVVPTYQEDPVIFETAIRSWLANQVEEIILVIDESDRVCQEIAARYPVTVLITDVPGKRDALRKGWNAASTDLVALVDSDTIWAPDVAAEVQTVRRPAYRGVGTRQSVYGSKGLLARLTDMFLDHRYFDENASQSLLGKAVSCLSGRTAIYRRSVLMDIEQDFMHETFWGVPCLSGDDKRLTTLTLERGHLTYMQRTAQVWSTFPDSPRVFRKQRLRWARNTWRSDLRALSNRWVWSHPFLAYTMIDKAVSGFTVLLGRSSWCGRSCFRTGSSSPCSGCGGRSAARPSCCRTSTADPRPSSSSRHVVFSWVMAIIKIHALLTIRKQRWLTRQVAVENGAVVRTGAGAGAGADAEVTTEPMRHRLPPAHRPPAPAPVPAPMPRRSRVAVAPPRPPRPEPRPEPRHARPSSSPQPVPSPGRHHVRRPGRHRARRPGRRSAPSPARTPLRVPSPSLSLSLSLSPSLSPSLSLSPSPAQAPAAIPAPTAGAVRTPRSAGMSSSPSRRWLRRLLAGATAATLLGLAAPIGAVGVAGGTGGIGVGAAGWRDRHRRYRYRHRLEVRIRRHRVGRDGVWRGGQTGGGQAGGGAGGAAQQQADAIAEQPAPSGRRRSAPRPSAKPRRRRPRPRRRQPRPPGRPRRSGSRRRSARGRRPSRPHEQRRRRGRRGTSGAARTS